MSGDESSGEVAVGDASLLVLALVLLAYSVIGLWTTARNEQGVDFYHFWVVPQVISLGESPNIYDEAERKSLAWKYWDKARKLPAGEQRRYQEVSDRWAVLETTGTPFLYTFFRPWVTGDYERDYLRYQAICSICGVFALLMLGRLFGHPLVLGCLGVVVCIDWFEPFQSDVRVANLNRLLLLGVVCYLWTRARRNRPWASLLGGAMLGLLVLFKPVVVFAAGLAAVAKLMTGRYRDLAQEGAGIALGAFAAVASSSVFFGDWRTWLRWIEQLRQIPDSRMTVGMGNYAPAMLLQDLWGWESAFSLGALFVLLTLCGAYIGRRKDVTRSGLEDAATEFVLEARMVSLGLLVYLLASRLVWLHYFVLTVPAFLLAWRPDAWRGKTPLSNVFRGASLAAALSLVALDPPMKLFDIRRPTTWAALVALGTLILFALTLWDLIQEGRRGAEGPRTDGQPAPTI